MTKDCTHCKGSGKEPQTIEDKIGEIFSGVDYPLYKKVRVVPHIGTRWFNYDYCVTYTPADRTTWSGSDMITTEVAENLYKLGFIIVNVGPTSTWVRRI